MDKSKPNQPNQPNKTETETKPMGAVEQAIANWAAQQKREDLQKLNDSMQRNNDRIAKMFAELQAKRNKTEK